MIRSPTSSIARSMSSILTFPWKAVHGVTWMRVTPTSSSRLASSSVRGPGVSFFRLEVNSKGTLFRPSS